MSRNDRSKPDQKITLQMSRAELEVALSVDAAMARRQDAHERPTIVMNAVKVG